MKRFFTKKNKGKRAFTLIELLAVILILGIIALIGIVSVNNIVEQARRDSYKASIRGVIRASENYISTYSLMKHKEPVYPMTFVCNGKDCSNDEGDKLEVTGKVPSSGTITIEDHNKIKIGYLYDGKHCAFGDKENIIVNKDCEKVDITKPSAPTSGKIGDVRGSNPVGTIEELASGSTDDESKVRYEYLVSNTPEKPEPNDKRFSSKTTFERACGRSSSGQLQSMNLVIEVTYSL